MLKKSIHSWKEQGLFVIWKLPIIVIVVNSYTVETRENPIVKAV